MEGYGLTKGLGHTLLGCDGGVVFVILHMAFSGCKHGGCYHGCFALAAHRAFCI